MNKVFRMVGRLVGWFVRHLPVYLTHGPIMWALETLSSDSARKKGWGIRQDLASLTLFDWRPPTTEEIAWAEKWVD